MLPKNNASQSAPSPRVRVILTPFSQKSKEPLASTKQVPAPPPATYHDTRPDIFDDFFGLGTLGAHRSWFRPPSQLSTDPPPYTPYGRQVTETDPSVYKIQEPLTLARMLFYYGFLFFPLWLIGIWILLTPLRPTDDWEIGKTEDEKAQLLKTLRATEKKWAFRCLYAMLTLLTIVALITVVAKIAMH